MEGSGLTDLSKTKGRLDLGNEAAPLAVGHRGGRLRRQSYLREQGEDLGGCGMSYLQSLKDKTALRKRCGRMDAR